MSRSDLRETDALAAVSMLEQFAERGTLSPDALRAFVSAATRAYARVTADAGEELAPLAPDVSTTDALTLACALLRSQDLTPFDMSIWFSRGQPQR